MPFFWYFFIIMCKNHCYCPSKSTIIIRINIIWFLRYFSIYSLLNKFRMFRCFFHIIIIPFIWNRKFIKFKTICYSIMIIIFNIWIMLPLFRRNNRSPCQINSNSISITVYIRIMIIFFIWYLSLYSIFHSICNIIISFIIIDFKIKTFWIFILFILLLIRYL